MLSATLFGVAGYKLESFFAFDKETISSLLTFFSIITAILLGAITLVGNSISILEKKTEHTKSLYQKTFSQRMFKLIVVFYIYLITIVILLCYMAGFVFLKKICVAFSFLSVFLSFILPVYIMKIYYDYYPK